MDSAFDPLFDICLISSPSTYGHCWNYFRIEMGDHGPGAKLIDAEGFPLADVDVHSVSIIRNQLVKLRNDFKFLSIDIDKEMLNFHALAKKAQEMGIDLPTGASSSRSEQKQNVGKNTDKKEDVSASSGSSPLTSTPEYSRPVFEVKTVATGSPSFEGGLRSGDMILSFGSCNRERVEREMQRMLREHSENTNTMNEEDEMLSLSSESDRKPTLSKNDAFKSASQSLISQVVRENVGVAVVVVVWRPDQPVEKELLRGSEQGEAVDISNGGMMGNGLVKSGDVTNRGSGGGGKGNDKDGEGSGGSIHSLVIVPQRWSGDGLLGCLVVPVTIDS